LMVMVEAERLKHHWTCSDAMFRPMGF